MGNEELQKSESHYRMLMEQSADGIFVSDAQGNYTDFNLAACDMLGYSRSELLNLHITDIIAEEEIPRLAGEVAKFSGGKIVNSEWIFKRKNGSLFTGELIGRSLPDGRLQGILRDITERKKAEEKIMKANRLYALISQVNQSIVQIKEEGQLLDKICSIAIEFGNFKVAWLGMTDASGKKASITSVAGHDEGIRMVRQYSVLDYDNPILRDSLMNKALTTGQYAVNNDLQGDPAYARWHDQFIGQGIFAGISLPIFRSGRVAGFFTLQAGSKDFFDASEIKLLEEAAGDISFALDNFDKERQRQLAEESLRKNTQRLNQAQHIAHLGSWELDLASGASIWSAEICRIFGLSPDENVQSTQSFLSFVHPDDLDLVSKAITESNTNFSDVSITHRIIRKDGIVKYLQNERRFEFDALGKPKYIHGTCQDITEKKEIERQISDNFALFRGLFESAPEAVFIGDCDTGKFIDCNDKAVSLFGYSHEELLEKNPALLSPEFQPDGTNSAEGSRQMVMRAMGGDKVIFEWVHLNGRGKEIDCEVRLTRLNITGRNLVRGSVIDITEKKQAEKKLQRANRLYAFISAVNQSIVHIREEQELLNKACSIAIEVGQFKMAWIGLLDASGLLNMISLRGNEATAKEVQKYSGIDYSSTAMCDTPTGRAIRTGRYAVSNDLQNDPAMTAWRQEYIQHGIKANISFPIKKFSKVVGVFGLNSTIENFFDEVEISLLEQAVGDISYALENIEKEKLRLIAEEKVKLEEEKYRHLFYDNPLPLWIINYASFKVLDVNAAALIQYGYSREEFLSMTALDLRPVAEQEKFLNFSRNFTNNMENMGVWIHLKKDGSRIYVDVNSAGIIFEGVEARLVLAIDVTEKRRAEEKLRRNEAQLKEAQTIAKVGSWEIDMVNNLLYWSDEQFHILGYERGEVEPSNELFFSMVHPDDSAYVNDSFSKTMQVFENSSARFRLMRKDGGIRHAICEWKFDFDSDQKPLRIYGIVQDITERTKQDEQQKLFTSIVNSSDDAIISKTLDGIVTTWNPGAEKILGYSATEIIGQNISMIAPRYLYGEDKMILDKIYQGESVDHYETQRVKKGGKIIDVSITVSPIRDSMGHIVGASKILRDVSDRKKAENEIRELHEKQKAANHQLSTILNTLPANIALLDESGIIIAVDEAWKKFAIENDMKGRHYGIGDNYLEVCEKATGIDSDGAIEMANGVRQVLQGALDEFTLEYPCNSPGEARWFRVEVRPLEEKKNSGAVVMHINVTGQKLAENEIKELNENLEKRVQERTIQLSDANKALEAFSYSVSHDLRAPVRAMMGFSRIIEQDYGTKMDPGAKELFGYIQENGKRMNAIIDDLLRLAKYERVVLREEPIDTMRLVNDIWSNICRTNPHHASLKLSGLPVAYADKSMIEQVFINLLSNAVKYSARNEMPEVSIWSETGISHYTFYIKDNGVGFDMKHYDKLFGAFQRLHDTNDFEGTGVGLTLVKRIIEKHGGVVGAEAEVGKGATFYFTLPIDRQDSSI